MKRIVKMCLNIFGYEIKRVPRQLTYHNNAYCDQKMLLLGDNPVIFDVGANIGQTAIEYNKIFDNPKLYCFEPFANSFDILSETTRINSETKSFKIAISNSTGKALLPSSDESQSYVRKEWVESLGSVSVDTITLDDFTKQQNIDKINILKMDIQGSELKALQGGGGLLQNHQIDIIYTEVLFVNLYDGQCFFCDIQNFLQDFGYQLYGLYDLCYGNTLNRSGDLAWGDAIFISSTYANHLKAHNPDFGRVI
jgi:FkbM family methyltransferase